MHRRAVLAFSLFVAASLGCGARVASPYHPPRADAPPAETSPPSWLEWRHARRESLAGEDGWLTLIGLHWLEAPETTLGSDPASGIALPADRASGRVGRIVVSEGRARFVPEPGSEALHDGAPVTSELRLRTDDPGRPTVLAIGSLRVHVIARGDRLGLRVKDRESPARAAFTGVPVYDYDPSFRVRARFEPAPDGATMPIVNVLGMQSDEPLAGTLRFEIATTPAALLATAGEDGALFVMFRDATADAGETYGGGRYLEVPAPGVAGEVDLDFNYAYTPPCAFTEHATCPMPPPENEIAVAIRAGERHAPSDH